MGRQSIAAPRRELIVVSLLIAIFATYLSMGQQSVYARGNPPSVSHVLTNVNSLHGGNASLQVGATRSKVYRGLVPNVYGPDVYGLPPGGYNPVYGTSPIIFVHGIQIGSPIACTGSGGLWTNPLSYLQQWHGGLGSDTIGWQGPLYVVGYYNADVRCGSDAVGATGFQLSTYNNDWAPKCDGVGGPYQPSDIGTNNEPLEHIACELSWFTYNYFAVHGTSVKFVAHSMGGLVTISKACPAW